MRSVCVPAVDPGGRTASDQTAIDERARSRGMPDRAREDAGSPGATALPRPLSAGGTRCRSLRGDLDPLGHAQALPPHQAGGTSCNSHDQFRNWIAAPAVVYVRNGSARGARPALPNVVGIRYQISAAACTDISTTSIAV